MNQEINKKQTHKMTIFAIILSVISIGVLVGGFFLVSSDKVVVMQSISNLTNKLNKVLDQNSVIYDKLATANDIGIQSTVHLDIPTLQINGDLKLDYLENKSDKKSKFDFSILSNNQELLDTNFILTDDKLYGMIQDITPKYYYTAMEYYSMFASLNSSDYDKIISLLKEAIDLTIEKDDIHKQKATILYNGKEKKVNQLSYSITEQKLSEILSNFITSIQKDKTLVSHMENLGNISSDEMMNSFTEIVNMLKDADKDNVLTYRVYYYGFNKIVAYELEMEEITLQYKVDDKETIEISYQEQPIFTFEISHEKNQDNFKGTIHTGTFLTINISGYQTDEKFSLKFSAGATEYIKIDIMTKYDAANYQYISNVKITCHSSLLEEDIEIVIDESTKYYFDEKINVDLSNSTDVEELTEEELLVIEENFRNHPLYQLYEQISEMLSDELFEDDILE